MSEASIARLDPRSPGFRANPYPTYRYLRAHEPIHYRPERRDFLLTRYADNQEVLRNPGFGRSDSSLPVPVTGGSGELIDRLASTRNESRRLMGLWLALMNPPDHTRVRRPLRRAFTQSRINGLQTDIQAWVDAAIDRAIERGGLDVIGDLAYPLMLDLNCNRILGIPPGGPGTPISDSGQRACP